MSRLAEQYGISDNGLAKICRRDDIPYPPRGYWTKHAAGKAHERTPLPESDRASRPITIYPTPLPEPSPNLPDDVRRQMEGIHAEASSMVVAERLVNGDALLALCREGAALDAKLRPSGMGRRPSVSPIN
jgi:hypothetical protein